MRITFASMKGGVAKTTSAVHFAAYLGRKEPTALIDADPNQSAIRWGKRGPGMGFEVMTVNRAISEARHYKHLVMDTKARPDIDELRELSEGCDMLIIPTTPDALSLEGMMLTLEFLKKMKAKNYRVLLTIVPPEPIPEGREARSALVEAGVPLFGRNIRRLMAFQRAVNEGITVGDTKDARAQLGALDYDHTCEEMERLIGEGK